MVPKGLFLIVLLVPTISGTKPAGNGGNADIFKRGHEYVMPDSWVDGWLHYIHLDCPDPAPMNDVHKDLKSGWKINLQNGTVHGLNSPDLHVVGEVTAKIASDGGLSFRMPLTAKPQVIFERYSVKTPRGQISSGKLVTNKFNIFITGYYTLSPITCDLKGFEVTNNDDIQVKLSDSGGGYALTPTDYNKFMNDLKALVLEASKDTMFKEITEVVHGICPGPLISRHIHSHE